MKKLICSACAMIIVSAALVESCFGMDTNVTKIVVDGEWYFLPNAKVSEIKQAIADIARIEIDGKFYKLSKEKVTGIRQILKENSAQSDAILEATPGAYYGQVVDIITHDIINPGQGCRKYQAIERLLPKLTQEEINKAAMIALKDEAQNRCIFFPPIVSRADNTTKESLLPLASALPDGYFDFGDFSAYAPEFVFAQKPLRDSMMYAVVEGRYCHLSQLLKTLKDTYEHDEAFYDSTINDVFLCAALHGAGPSVSIMLRYLIETGKVKSSIIEKTIAIRSHGPISWSSVGPIGPLLANGIEAARSALDAIVKCPSVTNGSCEKLADFLTAVAKKAQGKDAVPADAAKDLEV